MGGDTLFNLESAMKRIDLPVGGISVFVLSSHEGFIRSKLKLDIIKSPGSAIMISEYNASINMLETMILEHAKAGVDIEDTKYVEGIEKTLEKLAGTL